MTTIEKIEFLKKNTGRTWIKLAEFIGVSRQMLDFVRRGQRAFSAETEQKIDNLIKNSTANLTTIDYVRETPENYTVRLSPQLARKSILEYAETALDEACRAGMSGQFETLMLHLSRLSDPCQSAWHAQQAKTLIDTLTRKESK